MKKCKQCNQSYDGCNYVCHDCHWENERLEAANFMFEDEEIPPMSPKRKAALIKVLDDLNALSDEELFAKLDAHKED